MGEGDHYLGKATRVGMSRGGLSTGKEDGLIRECSYKSKPIIILPVYSFSPAT